MSDHIFSRPTTKEYREGWERIYGGERVPQHGSPGEPGENKVLLFKQRYRQLHPSGTRFSQAFRQRKETLKKLAEYDQEIGI